MKNPSSVDPSSIKHVLAIYLIIAAWTYHCNIGELKGTKCVVSEISCGGNQANVTNTVDAKISFYEESDLPTSVRG